jgi:7,8-dihydroneopterin aldolase/epimerase/oxygenase
MKIHLYDMIFYGHHGVHPEERKLGQRFQVDFTLETDPSNDKAIRHLDDTIDYTRVYAMIKEILENREFLLLEDCANTILDSVMEKFPSITHTSVKIRKPSVPINGSLSSVEIEMERSER